MLAARTEVTDRDADLRDRRAAAAAQLGAFRAGLKAAAARVSEPDRGAFLTFAGHLVDKGDCVVVSGPAGVVRLEGTAEELERARDLLRAMDGFTAAGSLVRGDAAARAQCEKLIAALGEVGAVFDRARAWSWFHQVSSNPPVVPAGHDPMAAYDLPRLAFGGVTDDSHGAFDDLACVDELACKRRSADLRSVALTPGASLRSAVRLARNAYAPRPDGRRPAASGGALYPLHFWAVGAADGAAPKRVLSIDHDRDLVRSCGEIGLAELKQLFVPDPAVLGALDRGAAVIVVAADPRRVTHKYGNRGWRYALMECGAVMHHITLAATSRMEAARPIGGYFDAALEKAIYAPALPLLTIIVAAGS